jgi:hypothetical protein
MNIVAIAALIVVAGLLVIAYFVVEFRGYKRGREDRRNLAEVARIQRRWRSLDQRYNRARRYRKT